MKRDNCR